MPATAVYSTALPPPPPVSLQRLESSLHPACYVVRTALQLCGADRCLFLLSLHALSRLLTPRARLTSPAVPFPVVYHWATLAGPARRQSKLVFPKQRPPRCRTPLTTAFSYPLTTGRVLRQQAPHHRQTHIMLLHNSPHLQSKGPQSLALDAEATHHYLGTTFQASPAPCDEKIERETSARSGSGIQHWSAVKREREMQRSLYISLFLVEP